MRAVTSRANNLISELVSLGLVDARSAGGGDLVVRDVSSRHRNLIVEGGTGPPLLVKRGVGPRAAEAVAREAAVLRALAATGPLLAGRLPRVCHDDAAAALLVLERVGEGEDLKRHHARLGACPAALGAATGRALAALHRAPLGRLAGEAAVVPWVLEIDRPALDLIAEASPAGLQIVEAIQRDPRLGRRLREIDASWSAACIAHNDIKWDNIVVVPGPDGGADVCLVDWELASPGDPCWDVGSAIGAYLSAWLHSIPDVADRSPSRLMRRAAVPLESLQPAMRDCWRAYADEMGLEGCERARRALRVARLAGVRLLVAADEAAHAAPALTAGDVLHLQVSANVLERPADALVHLVGLRPDEAGDG